MKGKKGEIVARSAHKRLVVRWQTILIRQAQKFAQDDALLNARRQAQ
jgi:hypothetical protein